MSQIVFVVSVQDGFGADEPALFGTVFLTSAEAQASAAHHWAQEAERTGISRPTPLRWLGESECQTAYTTVHLTYRITMLALPVLTHVHMAFLENRWDGSTLCLGTFTNPYDAFAACESHFTGEGPVPLWPLDWQDGGGHSTWLPSAMGELTSSWGREHTQYIVCGVPLSRPEATRIK